MTQKNKITYCLWLNKEAEEAVNFYASVFPNLKITNIVRNPVDTPSGKAGTVLTAGFELEGQAFMLLNGGAAFSINPSISFILNFDPSKDEKAGEHLEKLWHSLCDGGEILMPLNAYPFSKKYGWCKDKFGVTWQLMLTNPEGEERPFVTPNLMFSGHNTNHAEEAMDYYLSIFKNGRKGNLAPYPEDTGPAKKGALMYGDFQIKDTWLAVMDSGVEQHFTFNEGVSIVVHCDNQEDIDYYWEKLSAQPEAEACGWLKDKYGVSWQIVPVILPKLLQEKEKSKRVMEALMKMRKPDIKTLTQA